MNTKLVWIVASSGVALALAVYLHDEAELERLGREIVDAQLRESAPPVAAALFTPARHESLGQDRAPPTQAVLNEERNPGKGDDRPAGHRSNAAARDDEAPVNAAIVGDAFAAQPVDRAWAPNATVEVHERLGTLVPPAASLGNADCRSSMCRVELVARDHAAMKQFVDGAFGVPAGSVWHGPMMAEYPPPGSDGTAHVILYLGRAGSSLWPVDD